jgi:hypothetical protein
VHIREAETDGSVTVGWGLTVGIVTLDACDGEQVLRCLAGQGAIPVALRPDRPPPDVAVAMIAARGTQGIAAAERFGRSVMGGLDCPLVILTEDCAEQIIPHDLRQAPILMRAPLSPVSARVLLEHLALKRKGAHRRAARP